MDIKLIDGLKMLEFHNECSSLAVLILVICALSIVGSIVAFIKFFGEVLKMSIFVAITFISILIMAGTDKYGNITTCQVIIEDEQKCTYQDIVNNYKVTNQDGLIYTIELPEDNE